MSDNVAADTQQSPQPSSAANEVVEIIKTVVYALAIALVLRVIFFQPFTIPSASMEPNLYQGDYIIVSKYSYGWSRHSIPFSPALFEGRIMDKPAHRGDIVVFKLPRDGHTDYVKRIIGVGGDRVQMKAGLLYLNGQQVQRKEEAPSVEDVGDGMMREVKHFRETLPDGRSYMTSDYGPDGELDDTEVYVVPEGHYFVMGDNRDNSLDSRVSPAAGGVGFVPADHLVGRAQIILLSWGPEASIFKPWTWVLDIRLSRFFNILK